MPSAPTKDQSIDLKPARPWTPSAEQWRAMEAAYANELDDAARAELIEIVNGYFAATDSPPPLPEGHQNAANWFKEIHNQRFKINGLLKKSRDSSAAQMLNDRLKKRDANHPTIEEIVAYLEIAFDETSKATRGGRG
jgi:hypothetical protein